MTSVHCIDEVLLVDYLLAQQALQSWQSSISEVYRRHFKYNVLVTRSKRYRNMLDEAL